MNVHQVIGISMICALLMGCTQTGRVAFDHASAGQSDMMSARYDCLRQSVGYTSSGYVSGNARTGLYGSSSGSALPSHALTLNCMALKGYSRNDEGGRLVVPPELIARTY